jgi:UDP-N-acetylmuramoylalanine--D-glutamate ligase
MKNWDGRKVLVIGAARQGVALARYLGTHGAKVILNDCQPTEELSNAQKALEDVSIEWVFGGHPINLLQGVNLVCPSGGIPLTLPIISEAQRLGVPLSNDSQIFLEATPCPVVGITGSAGKTTTTTLVGRMMQSAVELLNNGAKQQFSDTKLAKWPLKATSKIWVGGNIGAPLISSVDEMKPDDLAIMELSSFQLELMTASPQIAVVLNVTPNHLDRHRTMDRYISAKARILEYQSKANWAVLNRDDRVSWDMVGLVRGSLISFGLGELIPKQTGIFLRGQDIVFLDLNGSETTLMTRKDILLRGEHNLFNVMASCAVGSAIGIPAGAMRLGVEGFDGLPHRLEFVRSWGGARWFNDSIATAPDRAIAAIRSFDEPIILLAGGRDKDLAWDEFAAIVRKRVSHLILFGEAAGRIYQSFSEYLIEEGSEHDSQFNVILCKNLEEAVKAASQVVSLGSIVLLSPGGASYDEFRDFEDRGEAFRRCVMQLQ